jgi:hypothetical protein
MIGGRGGYFGLDKKPASQCFHAQLKQSNVYKNLRCGWTIIVVTTFITQCIQSAFMASKRFLIDD